MPYIFSKIRKDVAQNLLSAAVVIGPLIVKTKISGLPNLQKVSIDPYDFPIPDSHD